MNTILLFVLLVAATVSQSPLGKKTFRCDYTYFEEAGGYLKFQEIPANFKEARLRCDFEGGILASPVNAGLRSAISKLVKQNGVACAIRTGIHATFSRGDFFSVEGVHLSRIAHEWAKDEPDNIQDKENCIIQLSDGKFADISCNEPFPYVCYKKGSDMVLNACGTTDNDYQLDPRTGSCYKFHRYPRTWSRAYMKCAAEGGHLAVLNSETEAQVIRDVFAKNPAGVIEGRGWKDRAFIGVHDWGEHGEWWTVHGQRLDQAGYDKFAGGEPNNGTTGQFCLAVYRTGTFDDLWCENPYAFICEKNPNEACP